MTDLQKHLANTKRKFCSDKILKVSFNQENPFPFTYTLQKGSQKSLLYKNKDNVPFCLTPAKHESNLKMNWNDSFKKNFKTWDIILIFLSFHSCLRIPNKTHKYQKLKFRVIKSRKEKQAKRNCPVFFLWHEMQLPKLFLYKSINLFPLSVILKRMISCTDIHDIAQDKSPKVTNSKGLDMEYQQQGLEQN